MQLLNGKGWVPSVLVNAENRCFPKDSQGLTPSKGMNAGQPKIRECPEQEKWACGEYSYQWCQLGPQAESHMLKVCRVLGISEKGEAPVPPWFPADCK